MDHYALNTMKWAVETDIMEATQYSPLLVDELGKKYRYHEVGMIEIIKSLKDDYLTDIRLERILKADGSHTVNVGGFCLGKLSDSGRTHGVVNISLDLRSN